jgi:hypothetical protein
MAGGDAASAPRANNGPRRRCNELIPNVFKFHAASGRQSARLVLGKSRGAGAE